MQRASRRERAVLHRRAIVAARQSGVIVDGKHVDDVGDRSERRLQIAVPGAAPMHRTQATVTVELFNIHDAERMRAALAIRTRVFVDEQGGSARGRDRRHDRSDDDAVHALVFDDVRRRASGTGRFYRMDATAVQIGRMAIDAQARGLRSRNGTAGGAC